MTSPVLTNCIDFTDLSPLSCLLVMYFELNLKKKSPEEYGIRAVVCNSILRKTTKHSAQGQKTQVHAERNYCEMESWNMNSAVADCYLKSHLNSNITCCFGYCVTERLLLIFGKTCWK